jgi:phosphoribosylformylglycinamidine cyclo-ligase
MAHITGGGITDNLPRVLPSGTAAVVRLGTWQVPPVFRWLERAGAVPQADMLRTFNMGIGLVLVVAAEDKDRVINLLRAAGESEARAIGDIREGAHPQVCYSDTNTQSSSGA